MTSPYRHMPSLLLGLLLAIAWQTAGAEKVYKWVDEKGATHYGQQPPAEKPASIEKVQIEQSKPEPGNNSRLKSTLDVANELEDSRLERERLRLEQKKVNIEKQKAEQAQQRAAEQEDNTNYNNPNYGWPRPPLRPRPPQRPVRPIRPVQLPARR